MHLRLSTVDGRTWPDFTPVERGIVEDGLAHFNASQSFMTISLCDDCHGFKFTPAVGAKALAQLLGIPPSDACDSAAITPELQRHLSQRLGMIVQMSPAVRNQIAQQRSQQRAPYGIN